MTPLQLLACGRIALGVASLAAPETFARTVGVAPTAATTYLTRIYGARAVAMGTAYLSGSPAERDRWHRMGLAVDITDTVQGIAQAQRGGLPARAIGSMVALTGGYAAVGVRELLVRRGRRGL